MTDSELRVCAFIQRHFPCGNNCGDDLKDHALSVCKHPWLSPLNYWEKLAGSDRLNKAQHCVPESKEFDSILCSPMPRSILTTLFMFWDESAEEQNFKISPCWLLAETHLWDPRLCGRKKRDITRCTSGGVPTGTGLSTLEEVVLVVNCTLELMARQHRERASFYNSVKQRWPEVVQLGELHALDQAYDDNGQLLISQCPTKGLQELREHVRNLTEKKGGKEPCIFIGTHGNVLYNALSARVLNGSILKIGAAFTNREFAIETRKQVFPGWPLLRPCDCRVKVLEVWDSTTAAGLKVLRSQPREPQSRNLLKSQT